MKLRNKEAKNEKDKEKEKNNTNENQIEIVIGDNSNLDISDVGDCMNDLRPKSHETNKKNVVIPKTKK